MNIIEKYTDDSILYKNDNKMDMKLLSLQLAISNYFKTYSAMEENLIFVSSGYIYILEKDKIEETEEFFLLQADTIIHFQHFFELIMKNILESIHPLLALDTNKPLVKYKLINNVKLTNSEEQSLYSIEFSEALETICKLIKYKNRKNETESDDLFEKLEGELGNQYDFFTRYEQQLKALNTFRNRILHRGYFCLTYTALDQFIAKEILPLVKKIIELEEFEIIKEKCWNQYYHNIHNLNCLDKIIECLSNDNIAEENHQLAAFMKALGCAMNSKKHTNHTNHNIIKIKLKESQGFYTNICECPNCGKETLVSYKDYLEEIDEFEGHDYSDYTSIKIPYEYESYASCLYCGLSFNKYISNLNEIGFEWDDVWKYDNYVR